MTEFFPQISGGDWIPDSVKCTFPAIITCCSLLLRVRPSCSSGGSFHIHLGGHGLPTHPSFMSFAWSLNTPRPLTPWQEREACHGLSLPRSPPQPQHEAHVFGSCVSHLGRSGALLSGLSCVLRVAPAVRNTSM